MKQGIGKHKVFWKSQAEYVNMRTLEDKRLEKEADGDPKAILGSDILKKKKKKSIII